MGPLVKPAPRCVASGTTSDNRVAGSRAGAALGAGLLALSLALGCTKKPAADPSFHRSEPAENENDNDADGPDQSAILAATKPQTDDRAQLTWMASEREAVKQSKAERRPMLVHFSTEWCADCKRMMAETFGDDRVKTQAGRFVAVRIEATNEEDPDVGAALAKYAVVNVPTLILLDSTGREQRRFTEFVPATTLLSEIQQVQ